MLFDKNKYERRSRELFDDLGLKNHEYNHMYERKRAIEKALKELEGIRLSSGTLRTAIYPVCIMSHNTASAGALLQAISPWASVLKRHSSVR